MQEFHWKNLVGPLSPDRLSPYGNDGVERRVVVARYLWNISVCEALYAPLHLFEISLRNAIHNAMVDLIGVDAWYDKAMLTSWGSEQINKAKSSLRKRAVAETPGRVVAELSFGFWTSLFEQPYERPSAFFLPDGIKKTFPHMPKSLHQRTAIKRDLERIRDLRNRIFHHERVIHWRDLRDQHQMIRNYLAWMNPEIERLATLVDNFPSVHASGIQPFIDQMTVHTAS
jgi:hypothetical protein